MSTTLGIILGIAFIFILAWWSGRLDIWMALAIDMVNFAINEILAFLAQYGINLPF